MNRMIWGAVALVGMASAASAADVSDGYRRGVITSAAAPAATDTPIQWAGPYVSIGIGYGITTNNITTTTSTDFPAAPSLCYANASFNSKDVADFPPIVIGEGDEREHIITANAGASITNVTETECAEFLSGLPAEAPAGVTIDSGFTPATDAVSVTEITKRQTQESGPVGDVRIGYDIAPGRFIVGGFAEYDLSEFDRDYEVAIGARLGVLVAPRGMVYVLGAWSQKEEDGATFEGWRIGAGAEIAYTQSVAFGVEYHHTEWNQETIANAGGVKVSNEPTDDRFLARMTLRPNFAD